MLVKYHTWSMNMFNVLHCGTYRKSLDIVFFGHHQQLYIFVPRNPRDCQGKSEKMLLHVPVECTFS